MIIVGTKFPAILRLPSKKKDALAAMNGVFSDIADRLLAKAKEHGNDDNKSVMGLLREYNLSSVPMGELIPSIYSQVGDT